jgi:hypothetical protein
MENLPLASLGACEALYNKSIAQYFIDAYKSPNRQSYSDVFEKIMEYLQVNNHQKLAKEFATGTLNIEDTGLWTAIQSAIEKKEINFGSGLPQFKNAITELRKSAVV